MPLYIMLTIASNKTHRKLVDDPNTIKDASEAVSTPVDRIVNSYAVLGLYDYVIILEAHDNLAAARISTELAALTGLSVQTLPALSMGDRVTPLSHLLQDVTDVSEDLDDEVDNNNLVGLFDQ